MYTIEDYLKYYKDYDLKEISWNIMDNLFLAILSYVPLKSFLKKDFNTFVDSVLQSNTNTKDLMIKKTIEILSIVKGSKRYQDMIFKNFINRVDSKTQFGAFTCQIKNIKIISFKGTDGSIIGWLENFRLAYMYPTYTQEMAIDYLNKNISFFDTNVYVIGHSKGGNLAISSSMELNSFKFKKIKKVINFDGPGVRLQEFNSFKYQRLSDKLINIIPTGSYIGTLLYNQNYKVIKTSSHAINEHYPTSWNSYGTVFIEGTLSKLSQSLMNRTTNELSKLDSEKVKKIFEESFKIFKTRETSKMKITLNDITILLKSVNNMDKELSSYITTIITTMLKLSKKNNMIN